MADGSFIKIKNVHFKYEEQRKILLNGITLDIEEFEISAFVGKVGCGKSSLLKHLNGLNKPMKGSVTVDGAVISEGDQIFFKEIGYLFEEPENQIFYPIVADDIAFGPRNLGLKKKTINQRVIEACEEVGILHLIERETISLSLGEKTLVALAGIIAMRPKVLLLDNPGSGLDIWTKPRIIELFKELSNNHTIIIATNDPDFLKIADKIFLLHQGKIKGKYKSYRNFRNALSRRQDTLTKSKDD